MNREYVESSMITSIGYDAEACLLEVEFKDGVALIYDIRSSDLPRGSPPQNTGKRICGM